MTRARSLALRTAPVLTLSLLVAAPARAHGSAQIGDFYQGLFQPVFHPEFLLGAVVIALWSTQQQQRAATVTCVAFAACVAIGSASALIGVDGEQSIWGPRLCMLALGPAVAARVRLPDVACAVIAGAAGLLQGHAATAGELTVIARPVLWTLGLALGAGLLGVYANAATQRFPAFWMQVGVRVAGSWIAAIGLLSSVMAARGR